MATQTGKIETQPVIDEPVAESTESPVLEVDSDLVKTTRDVVSRRRRVEELLATAEEQQEVVKKDIFLRVTADYRSQLDAILGEYHPLRDRVVAQLRTVRSEELQLRQRHEAIQDDLAELRFRCSVGEFGENELKEHEREKEEMARQLEKQLKVAEKTYETARELLGTDIDAALAEPEPEAEVNYDRTVPLSTGGLPPPPQPPGGEDPVADQSVENGSLAEEGEAPDEVSLAEDSGGLESVEVVNPSTAALARPRLQRTGPKAGSKSFLLSPEGELVLGRSTTCDVVVQGATISRRHAIVSCREGRYMIEDISSGGGVTVNGERVTESELKEGDEISVGSSTFLFHAS